MSFSDLPVSSISKYLKLEREYYGLVYDLSIRGLEKHPMLQERLELIHYESKRVLSTPIVCLSLEQRGEQWNTAVDWALIDIGEIVAATALWQVYSTEIKA